MSAINWYARRCTAEDSLRVLKLVRDNLERHGATQAANAVRRAIKSVDGARRHAAGRAQRQMAEGERLIVQSPVPQTEVTSSWSKQL